MKTKGVALLLATTGIAVAGGTAFTAADSALLLVRSTTTTGSVIVSGVIDELAPAYTTSQEQAILAAESYLAMSGFSKKGLIKQLSSKYGEGFPLKDAIFAAEHVKVNWYLEAVESARSYLELGGFSRYSLIRQLESPYGEQFTHAQAVYAANKVGL